MSYFNRYKLRTGEFQSSCFYHVKCKSACMFSVENGMFCVKDIKWFVYSLHTPSMMIFKRLKDHVQVCTQFWYVFDKIKSFEDLDLCKRDLLQVCKLKANGIYAS